MKMISNNQIYIFLACNVKFSQLLTVVVESAKKHTSSNIYLFLGVRDESTKNYFYNFLQNLKNFQFNFEIIIFDAALFQKFSNTHPPEACFRLFLWSKIPEYVERIIYLDSDIIINADLSYLNNLKFSTYIAAVPDYYWSLYSLKRLKKQWFHLSQYFNSWVVVIDLNSWRKNFLDAKMFNFLCKYHTILNFVDQDALNIVLNNNITRIDNAWNHTLLFWKPIPSISGNIFHFLGPLKPDSFLYPNIAFIKLFRFYVGTSLGFFDSIFLYLLYFFFSGPWSLFMFSKSKFLYKFDKIHLFDYFSLFLLIHPFIFFHLCREIYLRFCRNWLRGVFSRVLEFINS